MTDQPAERIKINPSEEEIAGLERYLEVGDLPVGQICARLWIRRPGVFTHPFRLAYVIEMHSRDWCALFDWWAINKWAEAGEGEPETKQEETE